VGAGVAASADAFPGLELLKWSVDSEIEEVQSFDIGIMPLPDDDWARGKSGYKLIQYMGCGLPVVASPVGVNTDIVLNGTNGFLANSEDDWRTALLRLIRDPMLRKQFGTVGRERTVRHYSLKSQAPRFVEVFQRVTAEGAG
jgi:glycosyltransferase involved in cell wall biosynthesis